MATSKRSRSVEATKRSAEQPALQTEFSIDDAFDYNTPSPYRLLAADARQPVAGLEARITADADFNHKRAIYAIALLLSVLGEEEGGVSGTIAIGLGLALHKVTRWMAP